jgi:hypothetical protein
MKAPFQSHPSRRMRSLCGDVPARSALPSTMRLGTAALLLCMMTAAGCSRSTSTNPATNTQTQSQLNSGKSSAEDQGPLLPTDRAGGPGPEFPCLAKPARHGAPHSFWLSANTILIMPLAGGLSLSRFPRRLFLLGRVRLRNTSENCSRAIVPATLLIHALPGCRGCSVAFRFASSPSTH